MIPISFKEKILLISVLFILVLVALLSGYFHTREDDYKRDTILTIMQQRTGTFSGVTVGTCYRIVSEFKDTARLYVNGEELRNYNSVARIYAICISISSTDTVTISLED